MVTFTMLAESKCEDPLSEQVIPAPGSSTHTATVEERPRRAAWMSRASAAATVGCDVDVHATTLAARLAAGRALAALAAGAAGASSVTNDPNSTTIGATSRLYLGLPTTGITFRRPPHYLITAIPAPQVRA